ncbi:hypothetical protein L6452_07076 [Arctium lappa]|uniref:Uncharacterized protein n=1 Tax=Arctium lappa TaxID=4217 RepID=A0ACB9EK92_ARCLA|nr:hypothetical protein L6452_07076 [Arctium lappa]
MSILMLQLPSVASLKKRLDQENGGASTSGGACGLIRYNAQNLTSLNPDILQFPIPAAAKLSQNPSFGYLGSRLTLAAVIANIGSLTPSFLSYTRF